MSQSRVHLIAFVFYTFLFIAQAGTWLSFNHRAHSPSDLASYAINDKDLTSVIKMCKEETHISRISSRNFAEMCAALSDIIFER